MPQNKEQHIHEVTLLQELENAPIADNRPENTKMYNRGKRYFTYRACKNCDFKEAVDLQREYL